MNILIQCVFDTDVELHDQEIIVDQLNTLLPDMLQDLAPGNALLIDCDSALVMEGSA